ncbi:MAG: hypothetical protein JW874_08215 [Spirochaetales bacterium]|nr:hypothetical protein [Spirochaetales bacterium]
MKIIERIAGSAFVQLLINIVLYSFYAALVGLSLVPSIVILVLAVRSLLLPLLLSGAALNIPHILLFALIAGGAVYLFFITAIVVMGIFIRLMSLGVREGVYKNPSFTLLRWIMYSGIYNIMVTLVLPVIPMSFFPVSFSGCWAAGSAGTSGSIPICSTIPT